MRNNAEENKGSPRYRHGKQGIRGVMMIGRAREGRGVTTKHGRGWGQDSVSKSICYSSVKTWVQIPSNYVKKSGVAAHL